MFFFFQADDSDGGLTNGSTNKSWDLSDLSNKNVGSNIKYCGLTIKSGISLTKIVVHWRYTEWDVMRI